MDSILRRMKTVPAVQRRQRTSKKPTDSSSFRERRSLTYSDSSISRAARSPMTAPRDDNPMPALQHMRRVRVVFGVALSLLSVVLLAPGTTHASCGSYLTLHSPGKNAAEPAVAPDRFRTDSSSGAFRQAPRPVRAPRAPTGRRFPLRPPHLRPAPVMTGPAAQLPSRWPPRSLPLLSRKAYRLSTPSSILALSFALPARLTISGERIFRAHLTRNGA